MSFCNYKEADRSDDDEDFIIDDNFSSDYNEFRTNSSSSSIKWSVDARKQNEEDWLSIERILYGEQELPEDEKTSEEFQSWMRAFPHLRIVGTKIHLPAKTSEQNSIEYVEEVLAIDPPIQQFHSEPFRLLDHELNEKLSIRKARQASGTNQSRAEDLEKLLRITSSGLTRNQPQQRPQTNKKHIDRTSTFIIKQSSVPKKLSKIQEHKMFELSPAVLHTKRELDNKLSYSATSSSRMGPILNVKFLYKKPDNILLDDVKSVKSASKLPLYADITTYERQKQPKQELSSKSASIHHQRKVNPNTIHLPPFSYDFDFPIIQGRGYNNQTNSKFIKH